MHTSVIINWIQIKGNLIKKFINLFNNFKVWTAAFVSSFGLTCPDSHSFKHICPLVKAPQRVLCFHRYLSASWRWLWSHWGNSTAPFQRARIAIPRGRKRSTRWSANWMVMYQQSSKVSTWGEERAEACVPQWSLSQCGLTRLVKLQKTPIYSKWEWMRIQK